MRIICFLLGLVFFVSCSLPPPLAASRAYDLELNSLLSVWYLIPAERNRKLALQGSFVPLFGSIVADERYNRYRNDVYFNRDWNTFYSRISDCLNEVSQSDGDDIFLVEGVMLCDKRTLGIGQRWVWDDAPNSEESSWVHERVEDAEDWVIERDADADEWIDEQTEDAKDWVDEKVEDADDWSDDRVDDASDWVDDRADDSGDWLDRRGEDLKKVEDNIKRGFKKLFD